MEAAPLFPLVILLLGGATVAFRGRSSRAGTSRSASLSWMVLLGALVACLRLWGGRVNTFGLMGSDLTSQFLSLLVLFGIAGTLAILSTTFVRGEISEEYAPKAYGSVLVASAGMLLMVATRNLGVIFVALEIIWYGFATFSVGPRSERYYFTVPGGISSLAVLLGLVFFWFDTGHLDVAAMEAVFLSRGSHPGWIPGVALCLFILGLILKMGAIHFDSRRARSSAFAFSATVQVAVFGALLRVMGWSLVLENWWKILLGSLTVVFLGVGSLMVVRSRTGHRSWAFAQFGLLGVVLLGLAAGGENGRSSVLFYLFAYIFMSLGAIAVAVALRHDPWESTPFVSWKGEGWRHPILAGVMGVFLLCLAGVPPTIGFWGRFHVYLASVRGGLLFLLGVALLNMLIGFTFYLRSLTAMWLDETSEPPKSLPVTLGVRLLVLVSLGVVLVLGVMPEPLLSLTKRVALELF